MQSDCVDLKSIVSSHKEYILNDFDLHDPIYAEEISCLIYLSPDNKESPSYEECIGFMIADDFPEVGEIYDEPISKKRLFVQFVDEVHEYAAVIFA
jgi:hypothetical protein